MKKSLIIIIATIIAIVAIMYFKGENKYESNRDDKTSSMSDALGYKNISYVIDGEIITLKDGISETESAPGSALKTTTTYFGNEVKADFNGDGREDIAFLLSQETGGTGVFFYVVAALNTVMGYKGTEAYFIGDRISPQSTNMAPGNIIVVNYVDRAPEDSFAMEPFIGKSLRLMLDTKDMVLKEVGNK